MSRIPTVLQSSSTSNLATMPGLFMWYDPTDTLTITQDGMGRVSQLDDKGPNAFNVTQGTQVNQPNISTEKLNGKPVLDFAGNQWLENRAISGILNGINQSFTIFSVVRYTDPTITSSSVFLTDKDEPAPVNILSDGQRFTGDYQNITVDSVGSNIFLDFPGLIGAVGNYDLLTTRLDNETSKKFLRRINGVTLFEDNVQNINFVNINTLVIGAALFSTSISRQMLGQVAQLIIFDRALSDQEMIGVELDLNNGLGLGIASYDVLTQGLFAEYNPTTIVTDTGSNVVGWDDKTTNNNDLTKAGDSNTLTLLSNALNGQPGIDFGTSGFTRLVSSDKATWQFLQNTDWTVIVVCKTTSSNPDNFQGIISTSTTSVTDIGVVLAIDDRSGSSANDKVLLLNVNGSSVAIDADAGNGSFDLSKANIITYRQNNTGRATLLVNNILVINEVNSVGSVSGSDPSDFLSIGSASTLSEFQGVILHALFYKSRKSDLEIQIINETVASMYSLALPVAVPLLLSVEPFSITISATNLTNTATIAAVDTSRAVALWYGNHTDGADNRKGFARLELTDSTTVTATRDDNNNNCTVRGAVVKFEPVFVPVIRTGTISVITPALTGTDTITSVFNERSICLYAGVASGAFSIDEALCRLELTDSTTVTATFGDDPVATVTVQYIVLQFDFGKVQSVEQVSIDVFAELSDTATITPVDMTRSSLFWQGQTMSTATQGADDSWVLLELTNGTTVTATKKATGTVNSIVNGVVVQWAPGVVKSIQRGTIAIGSGNDSNTATITAVGINNSMLNYLGFNSDDTGASGDVDEYIPTLELTDSTTITAQRGTSDTSVTTVSWELVEFV